MALLDFQTALGRAVRNPRKPDLSGGLNFTATERARLSALVESAGFRFTVDVQRSWSVGRAAQAARLTLSLLPVEERRRLLDEWVDGGGGSGSFFAAESAAFLEFIARQLPDPSHQLTLCLVERATHRAAEGARQFAPPDLSKLEEANCEIGQGRYASMVRFYAEPHLLLGALSGQPLPPLGSHTLTMLFGPGLDGLCREAAVEETNLWERLKEPVNLMDLLGTRHPYRAIASLIQAGGVEYQDKPAQVGRSFTLHR